MRDNLFGVVGSEPEICPRCHRQRLVRLRSMDRHSELEWYKCDGCEHLLTRQRQADETDRGYGEHASVP